MLHVKMMDGRFTFLLWIIYCSGAIKIESRIKEKILLGYLTGSSKKPNNFFYEKPGQSISGSITLAVKEINANPTLLPDHELDFMIAETYGEELESVKQTVLMMQQNLSAYIGPQETCVHEARIAASFNLPMISYVSILTFKTLMIDSYVYVRQN